MIKDNLAHILENVASICARIKRDPSEITLIGVTKYSPVDQINEAIEAGLAYVGENRVQDAEQKFPLLKPGVIKHMIGHLQSNKVKLAVELFDLIESVDSLKLAQEIDKQAAQRNKVMDVLIQVNVSGEEQKFGVEKTGALQLIEAISKLNSIRVLGLMTMAPLTDNTNIIRKCFKDLKDLLDQIKDNMPDLDNVQMKYLSMGMSSDYEIALEEGANMIRIGSAIFK